MPAFRDIDAAVVALRALGGALMHSCTYPARDDWRDLAESAASRVRLRQLQHEDDPVLYIRGLSGTAKTFSMLLYGYAWEAQARSLKEKILVRDRLAFYSHIRELNADEVFTQWRNRANDRCAWLIDDVQSNAPLFVELVRHFLDEGMGDRGHVLIAAGWGTMDELRGDEDDPGIREVEFALDIPLIGAALTAAGRDLPDATVLASWERWSLGLRWILYSAHANQGLTSDAAATIVKWGNAFWQNEHLNPASAELLKTLAYTGLVGISLPYPTHSLELDTAALQLRALGFSDIEDDRFAISDTNLARALVLCSIMTSGRPIDLDSVSGIIFGEIVSRLMPFGVLEKAEQFYELATAARRYYPRRLLSILGRSDLTDSAADGGEHSPIAGSRLAARGVPPEIPFFNDPEAQVQAGRHLDDEGVPLGLRIQLLSLWPVTITWTAEAIRNFLASSNRLRTVVETAGLEGWLRLVRLETAFNTPAARNVLAELSDSEPFLAALRAADSALRGWTLRALAVLDIARFQTCSQQLMPVIVQSLRKASPKRLWRRLLEMAQHNRQSALDVASAIPAEELKDKILCAPRAAWHFRHLLSQDPASGEKITAHFRAALEESYVDETHVAEWGPYDPQGLLLIATELQESNLLRGEPLLSGITVTLTLGSAAAVFKLAKAIWKIGRLKANAHSPQARGVAHLKRTINTVRRHTVDILGNTLLDRYPDPNVRIYALHSLDRFSAQRVIGSVLDAEPFVYDDAFSEFWLLFNSSIATPAFGDRAAIVQRAQCILADWSRWCSEGPGIARKIQLSGLAGFLCETTPPPAEPVALLRERLDIELGPVPLVIQMYALAVRNDLVEAERAYLRQLVTFAGSPPKKFLSLCGSLLLETRELLGMFFFDLAVAARDNHPDEISPLTDAVDSYVGLALWYGCPAEHFAVLSALDPVRATRRQEGALVNRLREKPDYRNRTSRMLEAFAWALGQCAVAVPAARHDMREILRGLLSREGANCTYRLLRASGELL